MTTEDQAIALRQVESLDRLDDAAESAIDRLGTAAEAHVVAAQAQAEAAAAHAKTAGEQTPPLQAMAQALVREAAAVERLADRTIGLQGERGDPGEQGPAGPIGLTGEAGERGPVGPTGPKGDAGDAGPQGIRGADGAPGEKGDKGDKGDHGAQGPVGPKGDRGEKGEAGAASGVSGGSKLNITDDGGPKHKIDVLDIVAPLTVVLDGRTAHVSGPSGGAGSQTLAETLALGNDADGLTITNLADPDGAQDAATAAFVDAQIAAAAGIFPSDVDAQGHDILNFGPDNLPSLAAAIVTNPLSADLDTGGFEITRVTTGVDNAYNRLIANSEDGESGAEALAQSQTNFASVDHVAFSGSGDTSAVGSAHTVTGSASAGSRAEVESGAGTAHTEVRATYAATTTALEVIADAAGLRIIATGLPTADPAVVGQLWNSGGALMVSAG